ncbi:DMT family transporter [Streptomyces sp. NPDC057702]|uniref:DMT family transporter n=1 Tax=unclassified Streptomyces TaxID=2593676 RepID=UPI0036C40C83
MPMPSAIGSAALASGLVVMWSSGFVGAELGTRHAPADTLLMWRFVAAAALLGVAWLVVRRRRLPARALAEQALIGLLSQGCYVGPVVWAVGLGVPTGTCALIAALQPLAAGALAGRLLGERVRGRQWAGLGVGLVGVALVVRGDLAGATAPGWAYALPFAGMAALLAASFLERRAHAPLSPTDALPVHCLTSALLFSAVAGTTGHADAPATGAFWLAVGWVVLLSTVGGYGFYWLSLRRDGVTRTSALIYLTPPTTAVWAYVMWGTRVGTLGLLGMAVCVAGVAAATIGRRPRPIAARPLDAGADAHAADPDAGPGPGVGPGGAADPVRFPGRPSATARCGAGR